MPHDESTSFGIEREYDADWARATFEGQRCDRIAKSDVAREGDQRASHRPTDGGMPVDDAFREKAGYKMRAPTRAGRRRRHRGACHDVAHLRCARVVKSLPRRKDLTSNAWRAICQELRSRFRGGSEVASVDIRRG